jgi:hypothetical protein
VALAAAGPAAAAEPRPTTRVAAPLPSQRFADPRPAAAPPSRRAPARRAAGKSAGWLTVDVGAFAARRELRFEDVVRGPVPLREHTASLYGGPDVRVAVYPAARFLRGAAGGAGLFASYGWSIGLKTRTDTGEERPTDLSRLELGMTWRSGPLGSWRLLASPALSWTSLRAEVAPAIPGLPDARLSGVRGSLDLELPLGRRFALLLGGGYVQWLGAQDLIAGTVAFFPGGSAWAADAEGGIAAALWGPLSARLVGELRSTRYRLDADPAGVYTASGASDTQYGARFTLRARY